jgi:NADH-quinone oxidoreductase subunit M
MIKLVLMGEFNPKWEGKMPEVTTRELVTLVPLLALTILLGVYPSIALRMMDTTISHLIKVVSGQF